MSKLLPYLLQHWRALARTFMVATIGRLLLLADPQILRLVVDRYVMHVSTLPRPTFVRGVVVLIAAAVAVGARRVGAELYAKSLAHSLLIPYRAFEKQRSGEMLHVIQRARLDAESGISGAVRLYLGAVAILAVTVYAFSVHPAIGLMHL